MAYHHGDLRRALLRGALELLAEGGPAHLTLRGAARRAGVSPAAPYRHFEDKRALLAAVAEEGFTALEKACADAAEQVGGDPVARFRVRGLAYVRFATEHPAHYRVMFGPEIPDKAAYDGLHAAAMAAFEALRSVLRDCAGAGCFPDSQVEVRAIRAWALVHGLASLWIDGQLGRGEEVDIPRFLDEAAAVLDLEAVLFEKQESGLPRVVRATV